MKKYSSQAQDKESKQQKESIEAAKDFAKHSDTTLIEQLRAQAILLSNKADQSKIYQDHLQAFYAWQAVLQQNNRDEQANFMAGIEAFQLHEKSSWEENIYWPKKPKNIIYKYSILIPAHIKQLTTCYFPYFVNIKL
ncbi:MAG: hypothetical protein Q4D63_07110 [Neisseria animaloris]|nr:hypothetical protein [Neisseria animaloris]